MNEYHRHRPRFYYPTVLRVNLIDDIELEKYDIFIPPPTTTATFTQPSIYSQNEYQPRTLNSYHMTQQTILPFLPPRSILLSMIQQPIITATVVATTISNHTHINEEIDLLLPNVPKQLLTFEQYQLRQMNTYMPLFELRRWNENRGKKNLRSFMLTFYKSMYTC